MLRSLISASVHVFGAGITSTARRMKKIVTIISTARHNNLLLLADCKGGMTCMGVGGDWGLQLGVD
jgi:putative N-acetylmannosamine-6-phosphate epimerase